MSEAFPIDQILGVDYRKNAVIVYNRLEASPRSLDFDRSLKAEIRDPLWMLTRQWQFGEFEGEDAASVFTARIEGEHTNMDRMQFPNGQTFPLNDQLPLETVVEREKIKPGLFIALQMGRYFIKLMKQHELFNATALQKFLLQYPLRYIPDQNDRKGIELLNCVQDKVFDGFLLHADMLQPQGTGTKFDAFLVAQSLSSSGFKEIEEKFRRWYLRNYSQQNTNGGAWLPSQLEYQFNVSSKADGLQQKTLEASQYYEGRLDWHSFDLNLQRTITLDPEPPTETVKEVISSFIPTTISFKGMPKPRFWMMEENQTDFGKIDTTPTGLLHLLLAEFGLIYSNDWFMLPYPLQTNTLCEIRNIIVTDVFGQHTLIRPAGRGAESVWQRWAMFRHTDLNNSQRDRNLFYLTPSILKSMDSEPLEQVNFLRDEMANLVWAVENTVPSQAGHGVRGDEMASKEEKEEAASLLAPIKYVLGTTVPENWIPFIPVKMENSLSEIRLQRAKLPGAKGPLGVVLNEKVAPYFVNEEEVPRAGVIIERAFNRTRWLNGKTFLWIGRTKQTGRGEGWSNLKFDQIG